ncbi:MAG: PadR family transcriptional regulator [Gemmatimonadetes bacterium]|nr:PadR family transcriptional regulator [Gemmatimonadota bacterium]
MSTLTRKGLLESHWEEEGVAHAGGGPRRKYYEVTPRGSIRRQRCGTSAESALRAASSVCPSSPSG